MKKTALTFLTLAIAACFILASPAMAGPAQDRPFHQPKRIERETRCGEHRRGEAGMLEWKRKDFRAHKRMSWKDDLLSWRGKALPGCHRDGASRHGHGFRHWDRKK